MLVGGRNKNTLNLPLLWKFEKFDAHVSISCGYQLVQQILYRSSEKGQEILSLELCIRLSQILPCIFTRALHTTLIFSSSIISSKIYNSPL